MTVEWTILCWLTIGATALYLVLFAVARRTVSIRFGRLAIFPLAAFVVRACLVIAGSSWQPVADPSLAGVAALLLAGRRYLTRMWLVRIAADDLARSIETACRGLRLGCKQLSAGRLVLTAGDVTSELRLYRIGKRLQFIVLPEANVHGKVALLAGWLAKQIPGPVPRIRIVLKKGEI